MSSQNDDYRTPHRRKSNFVLRDKRQRPGRNPQTGQPINITERRVLTFKASQILKHTLNQRPSMLGSNGVSAPATAAGPSAAMSAGAADSLGAKD